MTKYNIAMTDSLERALIHGEINSYYNQPTLLHWIGTLVKKAQAKLVSYAADVSNDMDAARKDGHKVTAA
ncbi:hypothetical protein [Pusillimonas sp.]|uniref:hypothetical protein n=1 Tax=Pusillimonas sp. TaxID=3040095 RepID=UPI0037C6CA51